MWGRNDLGVKHPVGAKQLGGGGKRPGGKCLWGETTREGNGLVVKRPGTNQTIKQTHLTKDLFCGLTYRTSSQAGCLGKGGIVTGQAQTLEGFQNLLGFLMSSRPPVLMFESVQSEMLWSKTEYALWQHVVTRDLVINSVKGLNKVQQ